MPESNRFIFNDEKQENSYGFSIRTDGIDLTRFLNNPVMLDDHWNTTRSVLGKWNNVKKEGGILSGVPEFDKEDKEAQKIAGKVKRGYIKSCSMGIRFKRENLQLIGGKLVLMACELMEVSIVAIPSNANSLRLYVDDSDTPLTDNEAKELTLSLKTIQTSKDFKNRDMSKIKLTKSAMQALGFAADTEVDEVQLSQKIVELDAKKKATELKLSAIVEKQEQEKLAEVKRIVDEGVKAGKIPADKKEDFVNLGIANLQLLESTLEGIPAKTTLSGKIENKGIADVKTADDFQKLSLEEQLAFKVERPDEYKKIFSVNN